MKAIKLAPASKTSVPLQKIGSNALPEIFVGGLSCSMTAEELKTEMGVFGTISASRILYYRDGRPRGFGFVSFEDNKITLEIVERKFVKLSSCVVECKLAVSKTESKQISENAILRKVNLEGLENQTEKDLLQYFGKFGAVSKIRFYHKKNELKEVFVDQSKATVTFKDEEGAKLCIQNGSVQQILDSTVSVSIALKNSTPIIAQGLSDAGTHYSAYGSSRAIRKNKEINSEKQEVLAEKIITRSKISNSMREVLYSALKDHTCAPNNMEFRMKQQYAVRITAPKSFRQVHREIQAAFMSDTR
jgi:RNA recognition motif-containing protein